MGDGKENNQVALKYYLPHKKKVFVFPRTNQTGIVISFSFSKGYPIIFHIAQNTVHVPQVQS